MKTPPMVACLFGLCLFSSLIVISWVFSNPEVLQHSRSSNGVDDGSNHERKVPPFSWNAQGCQEWTLSKKLRLTGLVATILLPAPDQVYISSMQKMVCNGSIASQRQNLLIPQGWDLLLVFATERPSDPPLMTLDEAADCMQLLGSYTLQTWQNLDGTNMTTRGYKHPTSSHTVFLAESQLSYPQYIQDNVTILDEKITPKHCQSTSSYIQGTRWYTHELLQLGILQRYDYFAKIDTDVWFLQTIPFHILWDLQLQNALLLHTAEYNRGDQTCSAEIVEAVGEFLHEHQLQQQQSALIHDGWHGKMCSDGMWQVRQPIDLYYTNFIIGRVDFWQSVAVRAFGEFLTNYPSGFFRHRWTDQIFFHFAMGLFLGPDFTAHVADYTELRCSPLDTCWEAIDYAKFGDERECPNKGYFLHTKFRHIDWNQTVADAVVRNSIPRARKYQSNCSEL